MNCLTNEQRLQTIEFYYQNTYMLFKNHFIVLAIRLPKMQELDLHDIWFQQDRATCHPAHVRIDLLGSELGAHFISRSGPVN